MRFSKSLCAVAILAVQTRSVLGALSFSQINNGFQQLDAKASTALADLDKITVLTGDLNTKVWALSRIALREIKVLICADHCDRL